MECDRRPHLKTAAGSTLAGVLALVLHGGAPSTGPTDPVPYPEGPPPGHTGGFGEPTCHTCHADYPLNEPGGTLRLEGLPAAYEPGSSYEIDVRLGRPEMARAGFQVAARIAAGEKRGTQAGSLSSSGDRVQRVVDPETRIEYVEQTRVGSDVEGDREEVHWSFVWTAPPAGAGLVVFHLAANAGNDDASEFGDRIYTDSIRVSERTNAPPRG